MKVTVQLGAHLYRAIQAESARSGRSVAAIVAEAIATWLAATEEQEDRESATASLVEYQRDGGMAADAFFGTHTTGSKTAPP